MSLQYQIVKNWPTEPIVALYESAGWWRESAPEHFWAEKAAGLEWIEPFGKVLEFEAPNPHPALPAPSRPAPARRARRVIRA